MQCFDAYIMAEIPVRKTYLYKLCMYVCMFDAQHALIVGVGNVRFKFGATHAHIRIHTHTHNTHGEEWTIRESL